MRASPIHHHRREAGGRCMITNLLAPGEQLLRANPMPTGNIADESAVLQAIHHDPCLDVERPAATCVIISMR